MAVLLTASAPAQTSDSLRYLPRDFSVSALAAATDGSVYAAGALSADASILRITADQVREVFRSPFPSGSTARISALAIGKDGIYAAGTRVSSPSANAKAFALKLDQAGKTVYLTFLGGASASYAHGLAVSDDGSAVVSGQTVDDEGARFPATPGTIGATTDANTGFIARVDAAGRVTMAIRGFGLGPIALDGSGNIFVAGAVYGSADVSPSPGAFQRTHGVMACGGTASLGVACFYQHIAKISADGTRLLYSTFVTGTYGATPAAIALTASGEVLVAGTTNSADYPVTAGALQTVYRASAVPPASIIGPHPPVYAPASSGYLTRLNADGTALVWSTFFSGTGADAITAMAIDGRGRIVVAGNAGSADLPRAQSVPTGCTPGIGKTLPFVSVLEADARTVIASRFVYGLESGVNPRLALAADGVPVVASLDGVKAIQMDGATPLACGIDPADNVRLWRAAPGQSMTLFGDDFGENAAVSVDGMPAPVLYRSARQINFQVPAQVAGSDAVTLTVGAGGMSMSRPLRIVPSQPAAFLVSGEPDTRTTVRSCRGSSFSPGYETLARNEDGGWNQCENPAAPGSVVTYYLTGLGANFDPRSVSLKYPEPATLVAVEPDVSGVWKLQVRLSARASSGTIVPLIDEAPIRNGWLTVWVARP